MTRIAMSIVAAAAALSIGMAHAGPVYGNYGQGGYQDPNAPYAGGGQPRGPYGNYNTPPQQAYSQGGGYTGCAPDQDREVIGTLLGGIVGGIIGNQFGRGRGRTAATVAGVVLGGIAGNAITRDRWCSDRRADAYYYNYAYYDAFDTPSYGRRYEWRNNYSGNWGYVEPIGYTDYQGYDDCREFSQTIYIDGRPQYGRGVACRQRDGSWRIVG
jgi:surface antigen